MYRRQAAHVKVGVAYMARKQREQHLSARVRLSLGCHESLALGIVH